MRKKILIFMSTYNGEKYLSQQLDSILSQSIINTMQMDIYIRDDGSSDQTLSILETYQKQHSNITVEKGKNIGIIASFFTMIKKAVGYDFYALADQDDVWFSDKLEKGIHYLEHINLKKPALYASCSLLVDNDMKGNETTQTNRRGLNFNNVIIQNLMPGHTQIFNQKLADFINAYEFDYTRIIVHDYWLALIAISFGNICFDNAYHTYYRQHDNNSIGYGHGMFGWFTERVKRIKKAAAKDITRQDLYFYELFQDKLLPIQKQELSNLLFSQKHIFTRCNYLIHAHVYRQRKFETALFYILYFLGGYRIEDVL